VVSFQKTQKNKILYSYNFLINLKLFQPKEK
jgi:hypothetical protein